MTTRTPTTTIEKEQTIVFTNSNEQRQGQSSGSVRKTSRKRNPQRREKRKNNKRMRETEKIVDVICMDIQQSTEAGEENSNESTDRTSPTTTTTDAHREDGSNEEEVQQLHWEYRCLEKEVEEATYDKDSDMYNEDDQNRESEYRTKVRSAAEVQSPSKLPKRKEGTQETREDALYDDSESSILSDVDMLILVGRQPNDADSDSDSSDESFDYGENEQQRRYHTDNDNSSINDSDNDGNNTIPGL